MNKREAIKKLGFGAGNNHLFFYTVTTKDGMMFHRSNVLDAVALAEEVGGEYKTEILYLSNAGGK